MEQEDSFIHTGIRHTKVQKAAKFHYVLDKNEYVSAIIAVTLPELMKHQDEDVLQGFFSKLLHGITWCDGVASPDENGDSSICLITAKTYACTSCH